MRTACGAAGMSVDEFWDSRPVDVYHKVQGFFDYERQREQVNWERMRWAVFNIVRMNGFTKAGLKPDMLATFPWEKKQAKVIELTPREQYLIEKMDENMSKYGKLVKWQEGM